MEGEEKVEEESTEVKNEGKKGRERDEEDLL